MHKYHSDEQSGEFTSNNFNAFSLISNLFKSFRFISSHFLFDSSAQYRKRHTRFPGLWFDISNDELTNGLSLEMSAECGGNLRSELYSACVNDATPCQTCRTPAVRHVESAVCGATLLDLLTQPNPALTANVKHALLIFRVTVRHLKCQMKCQRSVFDFCGTLLDTYGVLKCQMLY